MSGTVFSPMRSTHSETTPAQSFVGVPGESKSSLSTCGERCGETQKRQHYGNVKARKQGKGAGNEDPWRSNTQNRPIWRGKATTHRTDHNIWDFKISTKTKDFWHNVFNDRWCYLQLINRLGKPMIPSLHKQQTLFWESWFLCYHLLHN